MGKGMLRSWQGRMDRKDRGGEGETAMGRGAIGRQRWGGGNGEDDRGGGGGERGVNGMGR